MLHPPNLLSKFRLRAFDWRRLRVALLAVGTPWQQRLAVSLGIAIGVCPLLGLATPVLTVLALWLRLNLPLIHAANYAVVPLQLARMVPLLRLGQWVSGAEFTPLREAIGGAALQGEWQQAVQSCGTTMGHAMVGWALIAPVLFGVTSSVYRLVTGSESVVSRR